MTWQIISVLLNAVIVVFMGKIIWDQRKRPAAIETMDLDQKVRVRTQPFSKPSGKRTPIANDDLAAWNKEQEEKKKNH